MTANTAIERRLLGLIGLGLRARNAVLGVEQVRIAARKGRLVLAIVAPDASENSRKKVLPLLDARRVRVVQGPAAAALGAVAGRDAAAVVGITDPALARGIRQLVEDDGTDTRHEAAGRRRAGGRVATKVARRNG
jgi:ribosomal protein L7Ae-like RNA K-turn-binding protein